MVCHKLHCCTVKQLTSLNHCHSASKRGCSAILPSSAVQGRQCNCSAPQPVASLPLAAVAAVARHQLANPPLSLWNTSIQKTCPSGIMGDVETSINQEIQGSLERTSKITILSVFPLFYVGFSCLVSAWLKQNGDAILEFLYPTSRKPLPHSH